MHCSKITGVAAAVTAAFAAAGIAATSAFAVGTFTVAHPYPMPQTSQGVLNRSAVDVSAGGFTPGTFVFAQLCDGLPPNSAHWTPAADCGPASANEKVPASGVVRFPGTDPNYAILVWHGSNQNDKLNGEQSFNCLAPDDDPTGHATARGNQPIDAFIPAWGSSKGGNTTNPVGYQGSAGSAPCQIRLSSDAGSYSTSDIFDPIDLSAKACTGTCLSAPAGSAGSGSRSASGSGSGATGSGASGSQAAGAGRADPPAGLSASAGHGSGTSLATTGLEIGGLVVLGLGLIIAGSYVVRRTRRRAHVT